MAGAGQTFLSDVVCCRQGTFDTFSCGRMDPSAQGDEEDQPSIASSRHCHPPSKGGGGTLKTSGGLASQPAAL